MYYEKVTKKTVCEKCRTAFYGPDNTGKNPFLYFLVTRFCPSNSGLVYFQRTDFTQNPTKRTMIWHYLKYKHIKYTLSFSYHQISECSINNHNLTTLENSTRHSQQGNNTSTPKAENRRLYKHTMSRCLKKTTAYLTAYSS